MFVVPFATISEIVVEFYRQAKLSVFKECQVMVKMLKKSLFDFHQSVISFIRHIGRDDDCKKITIFFNF